MSIGAPLTGTVATNTASATTIAVPYPASLTSSHIMILAVSVNNASLATVPGGWTSVAGLSATGGTNSPGLIVAIKQATGSESGNLTVTTPNVKSAGQIIAFSGVNLTTPQDVTATTVDKAAGSANMVLPTLTTTRSGCAVVYVGTMSTGADTATAPAFYTETGDGIGTGGWPITTGYQLAAQGATGSVTIAWSNTDKGVGALLALRNADLSTGGTLAGTATLAGDSLLGRNGTGDSTVTSTTAGAGSIGHFGDGTLTGTAALAGAASLGYNAAGTLAVTATLAGDGARSLYGTGPFAVTATSAGAGTIGYNGAGDLAATANIAFAAGKINRGGTGDLTVTAALAGDSAINRGGSGDLAVVAGLVAAGGVSRYGSGSITIVVGSVGEGEIVGRVDLIRVRAGTGTEWVAAGVEADLGSDNRDIRHREIIANLDRMTLSLGTVATQAGGGQHELDLPYTATHGPGTVLTETGNYAVTPSDWIVVGNGASLTITLPDPTTIPGRHYSIKNIHASALTLATSGGVNIDGSATATIAQWASVEVVSNGAQWLTI